jgi:hypothetical protein
MPVIGGTTAFEMKRKLIEQAKLRTALVPLNAEDAIWDSSYSGAQRPRQVLWFGETSWVSDNNASFGRTPPQRDEEYNIRVGIEINDNDDTQSAANAKAEAIMQDLENMVGDYRIFGIGGLIRVGIVPIGLGEGPGGADGSRAAFLALQVNVTARK